MKKLATVLLVTSILTSTTNPMLRRINIPLSNKIQKYSNALKAINTSIPNIKFYENLHTTQKLTSPENQQILHEMSKGILRFTLPDPTKYTTEKILISNGEQIKQISKFHLPDILSDGNLIHINEYDNGGIISFIAKIEMLNKEHHLQIFDKQIESENQSYILYLTIVSKRI